jgi:hypothetical protein
MADILKRPGQVASVLKNHTVKVYGGCKAEVPQTQHEM